MGNKIRKVRQFSTDFKKGKLSKTMTERKQFCNYPGFMKFFVLLFTNGFGSIRVMQYKMKGSQYCSQEYVKALQNVNITISMAGNSLENPCIERLNGINIALQTDVIRGGF